MAVYQGPVYSEMGSFAITNATVWTVSGETIENGTVVVEDGKIAAVGKRRVGAPRAYRGHRRRKAGT